MPNYASIPATALQPGDALALFSAETLTAPQASIAIARAQGPGGVDGGVTFSMQFAAAPTSSLTIQGANQDIEAAYQTIATSTNKQQDVYTDTGRWAFYRARLASQSAGGALTVIAQR